MAATPRPASTSAASTDEVDAYLARLGLERDAATVDHAGLERIHLAHLEQIPFENLDIVFAGGVGHDQRSALHKIVAGDASRGGWCFELNGALALLLEALGFDVRLLGAAVLLDGPSQTIEHLLLEVAAPQLAPHLVDVGFGDSFDVPLALNTAGPQDAGSGLFELIGSPQGTTLTRHVDGVPTALLRFKRVAHRFDDFAPIARALQADSTRKWATHPFATRRLTSDERGHHAARSQRVTLTHDTLKIERNGEVDARPVSADEWPDALRRWFSMVPPERPPGGER